jgi:hypothetical protein
MAANRKVKHTFAFTFKKHLGTLVLQILVDLRSAPLGAKPSGHVAGSTLMANVVSVWEHRKL